MIIMVIIIYYVWLKKHFKKVDIICIEIKIIKIEHIAYLFTHITYNLFVISILI
jgi:hypothetical protein